MEYEKILETVTPEWVEKKMEDHSLKGSDLKKMVGIPPQAISEMKGARKQNQNRVILYLMFSLLEK